MLRSSNRVWTLESPRRRAAASSPASRSMGTFRRTKRWLRKLFSCASGRPASSSPQSRAATCEERESVFEKLPVEIIHHIYSLLAAQDAARAACVSRGFLSSWRCYSNLTLSRETLGLTCEKSDNTADTSLISIVDHILKMHSGTGVEIFKLNLLSCENVFPSYLDRWLRLAVSWGVKELNFAIPSHMSKEYVFPCSVLTGEATANSIRLFVLNGCAFHPTTALGCFRKLTRLCLYFVDITDEELGRLLSNSFSLERLDIIGCNKIICLRIPCTLQKLKFLEVGLCLTLESVDIRAPKLSTLNFFRTLAEDISVANPWPLKDVNFSSVGPSCTLSFARSRFPAVAKNVESLALISLGENVNTPMLMSKFTCLKKLEIDIQKSQRASSFDILSLISFLDASPVLDSLILHLGQDSFKHNDIIVGGDNGNYRWNSHCEHDHLKQVIITGFCSAKNLIQFVIYILENSPSLECLTLDTISEYATSCDIFGNMGRCCWMNESNIAEAHRAVKAVNRYIRERVPTGVRFKVVEPCSRCHFSQTVVN